MNTDARPIRRWLTVILGVQIGIAAILMGADLASTLPSLLSPSRAPGIADPVGPGDQTRRFAPGNLPLRAPAPGSRPMPATQDMPSRLDMIGPKLFAQKAQELFPRIPTALGIDKRHNPGARRIAFRLLFFLHHRCHFRLLLVLLF